MDTPPWSTLLHNDRLATLSNSLSLSMIMTPSDRLVTIEADTSIKDCLQAMRNYFDQLPVLASSDPIGMFFRSSLTKETDPDSLVVDSLTPMVDIASIRSSESIGQAIEVLASNEACMVFDTETGNFGGLIHFSDLNKHPVRIYCYLWISAIEMSLAELIQKRLPKLSDWIDCISDHRQVQILGRLEYSKRQNIEILPTEGLDLSDLVNIVAKTEGLRELFKMSKKQFEKRANRLVDLRNRAMHPVRSLIKDHSEVERLATQLADLKSFTRLASELVCSN